MNNPYLSKDEYFILSTHHILVNTESFEMMLTSQRLILIDPRVSPFVLQSIPLVTIIAVTGGRNAGGESIITLSYVDPEGTIAAQPIDLIFLSVHHEQRTQECDEWAQKLEKHAVLTREEALRNGTLPYDPVKVLQPKVAPARRIEMFLPYKKIPGGNSVRPEPALLPTRMESPDTQGEEPVSADLCIPKYQETEQIPAAVEVVTVHTEPEPSGAIKNEEKKDISASDSKISEPLLSIEGESISCSRESGLQIPFFPEELNNSLQPAIGEKNTDSDGIQAAEGQDLQESIKGAGTVSLCTEDLEAEETRAITGEPGEAGGSSVTGDPEYFIREEPLDSRDEKPGVTEPGFIAPGKVENIWAEAVRAIKTVSPVNAGQRTGEEPWLESGAEVKIVDTLASEGNTAVTEEIQYEPEIMQQSAAPPPAAPGYHSGWHPAIMVAVIIAVVLVVVTGSFMVTPFLFNAPVDIPVPDVILTPPDQPVPTVQPIPTETVLFLPKTGVWVRIIYPGTFFGTVGNPELMKPVRGSGDQIYTIRNSDGIVQVSIQKEDNSGDMLMIEVIKNSTVIKRSTTRVPMGSIDILIDARTEHPPGIRPGDIP